MGNIDIPSVHTSIENIFLKRNKNCIRDKLNWRGDGRLEWICPCGIGHTVFTMDEYWAHGCCGKHCDDLVKFEIKFHTPDNSTQIKEKITRTANLGNLGHSGEDVKD